jgi:hypothetical protein
LPLLVDSLTPWDAAALLLLLLLWMLGVSLRFQQLLVLFALPLLRLLLYMLALLDIGLHVYRQLLLLLL